MYAYDKGCKGLTYYRVGSRTGVVKQKGEDNETNDSNEDESKVQEQLDKIEKQQDGICPECGSELNRKEGCEDCPNCFYSKCFL